MSGNYRVSADKPLTPADFGRLAGVSRETVERLEAYAGLLVRWQRRINLVGKGSLGDLWRRHMLDSAQVFPLYPKQARTLLDVGSGSGFPGMVLAILGVPEVHLVESDRRKCAFLREVARITGAPAIIHAARLEQLEPWMADVITARAIAPLPRLLNLVSAFIGPTTYCIFMKGAGVESELAAAREAWSMDVERFPSVTDSGGTILRLRGLSRGGTDR